MLFPAAAEVTAAAGKGAAAVLFQGAAAPITHPAATPSDAGTTVLPAFAAPVAAARQATAAAAVVGAAAAGSEGCEAALHSSPSPGRQQQRHPTLLPHSQPQQQVTRSLSRSLPSSSSSSEDGGSSRGGGAHGQEGTAADDSGLIGDLPVQEAHSPQQPLQQLAPSGAAAAQPPALAGPSAVTGDSPPVTAMAAAGGAGAVAQQQQQQVAVPVRQQLDVQQLTHLTQIAQAAKWSIAALSTEQREAVCATLGVGLDVVARFFEEEGGVAATGAAPRGVKRGVQDR